MTTANQRRIMEALHTKAAIDPAQEVAFRVQFLKDYLLSSGRNGFVLSISDGQDSALAGRLCQLAVEELRTQTGKDYLFIALRLLCWLLSISVLKRALMLALPVLLLCYLPIR